MLRSAEVFLKVWAVCLATSFVIIANRELMTSNFAVVASPVHSADGRRPLSVGMSAEVQLVDTLLEKVAHLENEMAHGTKNHGMERLPELKHLGNGDKKRILVTGGAGFVGSHLVDRLMLSGHEVIVVDNFFTGRRRNIQHWLGHPDFQLLNHDIVEPLYVEVDEIYHLASPASPPHYMFNPIKTIKTNTLGTLNMLGLARRTKAKVLLASTSEVYGDPEVHPQNEEYWGHVNPIGPRACYDEGKRVAETLMYSYADREGIDVRVARIFNTYGTRMNLEDGRVISNFITQALNGDPITIYGKGDQTRSFQYVSDLVDGLVTLMQSNYTKPVNLGNPDEHEIKELADIVNIELGAGVPVIHKDPVKDDPQRRRPDILVAKTFLGWQPKVPLMEGLKNTISYFREELECIGKKSGLKCLNRNYIENIPR